MNITNKWIYIVAYIILAAFTGFIFGGASGAFTAVCVTMVFFIIGVLVALLGLKAIEKFFSQH